MISLGGLLVVAFSGDSVVSDSADSKLPELSFSAAGVLLLLLLLVESWSLGSPETDANALIWSELIKICELLDWMN